MTAQDIREFRGYLKACTDRQVQGVYDKEATAGRDDYAELALAEAEHRGLVLDRVPDAVRYGVEDDDDAEA